MHRVVFYLSDDPTEGVQLYAEGSLDQIWKECGDLLANMVLLDSLRIYRDDDDSLCYAAMRHAPGVVAGNFVPRGGDLPPLPLEH